MKKSDRYQIATNYGQCGQSGYAQRKNNITIENASFGQKNLRLMRFDAENIFLPFFQFMKYRNQIPLYETLLEESFYVPGEGRENILVDEV